MIAKRTRACLARREPEAHRERAMLGLLEHVGCLARLVVVTLAEPPGAREFPPVAAEAVEPLTSHMVVDMHDPVALSGDGEIAPLGGGPVDVGRGQMQSAQIA